MIPVMQPLAVGDEVRDLRDPVAERHVRQRVVGERAAALGQQLALALVEPDAVHEHRPRGDRAHAIERAQRRGAVLLLGECEVAPLLGEVDVERAVEFVGERRRRADHRLRRAVQGVRRRADRDVRVRGVARGELASVRDRLVDRLSKPRLTDFRTG